MRSSITTYYMCIKMATAGAAQSAGEEDPLKNQPK